MTELSTRLEPKSAIISIHNHGLLTRLVIAQDLLQFGEGQDLLLALGLSCKNQFKITWNIPSGGNGMLVVTEHR